MYCQKCGADLASSAVCPSCGVKAPGKRTSILFVILAILMAGGLAFGVFAFAHTQQEKQKQALQLQRERDSALGANLHTLREATLSYLAETGDYPNTLSDLAKGIEITGATYDPATNKLTEVPLTKKGYLTGEHGINDGPIPRNPYVESNNVADHWTYNREDGSITFETPSGMDAKGKPYADY